MSAQVQSENPDLGKQQAMHELVKLADILETCDAGSAEHKYYSSEYRKQLRASGIMKGNKVANADEFSAKEISDSRAKALIQVKEYLDKIEYWEEELPKKQWGTVEHIAVSYLANYRGMKCEINLEIPDHFAGSMTGNACYKARKSLVLQQHLQGYGSIERGLIKYGLAICKGREEKKAFFEKYAVAYNERLKQKKQTNPK